MLTYIYTHLYIHNHTHNHTHTHSHACIRTTTRACEGNGTLVDGLLFDGLWDPYNDCHMGMAAEACASKHTFSREEQDRYAVLSYQRAIKASEKVCTYMHWKPRPCVFPQTP